jgi:hypothetical protein
MVTYIFYFKCNKCDKTTMMRYIPPADEAETTLSCKNCESPLLVVYNIQIYHRFRDWWEYKYKIYDIMHHKWILGDNKSSISKDSFWGWVMDHDGNREEN